MIVPGMVAGVLIITERTLLAYFLVARERPPRQGDA
jgi:hypothetical protein